MAERKKAEVQIIDALKADTDIMRMTKGNIFQFFAPTNTQGHSDVFIVVNRYESVPIDRTFSNDISLLRVKVEIVIYSKEYQHSIKAIECVREILDRDINTKYIGSNDGEIGLDPVEVSNATWIPFRLDYQVMERLF